MENVTWTEAARSLEACTGTFIIAVTDKVGLVAKDTLPKRTELEPAMSVVIPYPEPLTPQELQEAVTAARTLFDLTKVGVDKRQTRSGDQRPRLPSEAGHRVLPAVDAEPCSGRH